MQPTLELVNGDTLVVSATQLEVMRTCPKMYFYRYVCRRVPTVPNEAAQGGKAFDDALNHRYRTCGNKPVTPEVEQEMLALIDRAYAGVELPLEEWRTPARYKEVVVAYNQHWRGEQFEVLGVQVPFAVELGRVRVTPEFWYVYWSKFGIEAYAEAFAAGAFELEWVRVVLQGLLDLFIRTGEHVFVVDTKTSKNDLDGAYENSAQMKGYCYALQQLATLHPGKGFPPRVHGALINGVTIRPPYKQEGRTPRGNDKPRNQFTRSFPSFYAPERLEEWRRDTLAWVEQALGWVARDHFPANERHCTFHTDAAFVNYGYYGKNCPFLCVCTAPADQRTITLGSDQFMDYGKGPLAALYGDAGGASEGGA